MPDETISQNWTNQSLANLESGGGPSSLTPGSAGLQGVSFQTFDPLYGGAQALYTVAAGLSGSLMGVLMSTGDPFTSKGVTVDFGTVSSTTFTLACAAMVNASNGDLAAVTADFSATAVTGMFSMYWSGDSDSNAVGVKFANASYYVAIGLTWTGTAPQLLSLSAPAVNVGLTQPKLRSAILATGLVAATPPSTAVTLSAMTTNTSLPYIQVI
jgi:hypothetical protein